MHRELVRKMIVDYFNNDCFFEFKVFLTFGGGSSILFEFLLEYNCFTKLCWFLLYNEMNQLLGFPGGSVVKNLPANAEDAGDAGSIPESGRSPGERYPSWTPLPPRTTPPI